MTLNIPGFQESEKVQKTRVKHRLNVFVNK